MASNARLLGAARACGAALCALAITACSHTDAPATDSSALTRSLPTLPEASVGAEVTAAYSLLFDRTDDTARARYEQSMRATQECMTAAGFQYPIQPYTTDDLSALEDGEIGDADEVARLGYRNATLMEEREIRSALASSAAGPNELTTYIASLDGPARYAFFTTLLGPPAADNRMTPATPDEPYNAASSAGCSREGLRATGATASDTTLWPTQMERQFAELNTRVAADPRVQAALAAWQACMSNAGYEVDSRDDARVLAGTQIPVHGTRTIEVALENGQTVTVDIPALDQRALSDAIDREILIASADLACSQETGYDAARIRTRDQLRREFVQQWSTVIDELMANS